jgi:hypothetical protein
MLHCRDVTPRALQLTATCTLCRAGSSLLRPGTPQIRPAYPAFSTRPPAQHRCGSSARAAKAVRCGWRYCSAPSRTVRRPCAPLEGWCRPVCAARGRSSSQLCTPRLALPMQLLRLDTAGRGRPTTTRQVALPSRLHMLTILQLQHCVVAASHDAVPDAEPVLVMR